MFWDDTGRLTNFESIHSSASFLTPPFPAMHSTLRHVAAHVVGSAAVETTTETMNDWAQKTPCAAAALGLCLPAARRGAPPVCHPPHPLDSVRLRRSLGRRRLSPTLAIKDTADAMRAAGTTLFDFGIGETNPEVPVPDIIKQTIASSTMDEENHYSPAQGDPALLEAISEDLATNFDIPTSVDQLCVCPGPKDAIFKAAMAMCNGRSHRRRFVCFAPIYESFISIPLLVGGEQPLVLSTDPKTFLPDPAELRAALEANDDICCVIVNSPNNPTGA